jgi:RimJ/RimL family protein N-acetyltransferase
MKPNIRLAQAEDAPHLTKWLSDPNILKWFPMANEREIEDSVRIWVGYSRMQAGMTACLGDQPVGMANLYIQPYQKLAHQCLFSVIIQDAYRGQGIGTLLLESLIEHAKEKFQIELLHLEVYDGNPAITLYRKLGFQEYGRHVRFIKLEDGTYIDKIFMQRELSHGRA